jgi:flavin-dependent dehydrogenase
MESTNTFDVAIAGAGPAGASAAIHLAKAGARVLLIEEKKFPRHKLCGEFISPECLDHFRRLGVIDQMTTGGGAAVSRTVFYSGNGSSVEVPSEWFKAGAHALGLSRGEMDHQLLNRARRAGIVVAEETHASRLFCEGEVVRGLSVKNGSTNHDYQALITIDATGRARALARQLEPPRSGRSKNPLVAFKVHLENAQPASGACEIYFYRGGYGGLSAVEGGASNLCFIVAAKDVRLCHSNPDLVMREVLMKNARAAETLATAQPCTPWLSVSLETFGRRRLTPAPGLLAIGDAASFIDPFTGSGMLMALESGELAANAILKNLAALREGDGLAALANDYRASYARKFDSRLRVAGLLRRAAFVPHLDAAAILLFRTSARLRRRLARATRQSNRAESGVHATDVGQQIQNGER